MVEVVWLCWDDVHLRVKYFLNVRGPNGRVGILLVLGTAAL